MTGRDRRLTYGTIKFQEDDSDEKEEKYAGELLEVQPHVSHADNPEAVKMYDNAMHAHPVLTTIVQTFVLVLLSDICAQAIRQVLTKEDKPFDLMRLYAVGTWSIIFMGPSIYYWHEFLNWWITGKFSTIVKTLFDQVVFAPFFCGMFIFGVGVLEYRWAHPTENVEKILTTVGQDVYEKIRPTMTVNYMIWPPVLLINFSFVPKTWRLLFLNSVGFFWIILLTYITHRKAHAVPIESVDLRKYKYTLIKMLRALF